jgi:hypothetical protein
VFESENFEAKVIHTGGRIDLRKLWKEEENKEADPIVINHILNEAQVRSALQN